MFDNQQLDFSVNESDHNALFNIEFPDNIFTQPIY